MKLTKHPQRLILNVFFGIIIIIFIGTNYFLYREMGRISASNEWIQHTHRVINTSNLILQGVMELESLGRGYFITHDKTFIKDFPEKVEKIWVKMDIGKNLVAENPVQLVQFNNLQHLVKDRIESLEAAIKETEKSGSKLFAYQSVLNLVQRGQNISENIKVITNNINDNEVRLLHSREASFLSSFKKNYILSSVIDVFNILFLLGAIFGFNKLLSDFIAARDNSKQSELLLKGIISGSNEYILAIDRDYKILAFNESFKKEFRNNFGKNVAVGMNFKDALDFMPKEKGRAIAIWDRALKGEEFTIIEGFGFESSHPNQYEITFSSIYNEEHELIGASQIARNVNARMEHEKELEQFNLKMKRMLIQAKRQAHEMMIVNDMNNKLRNSVSIDETLSMASLFLKKLFPFSSGAIYLMNASKNFLELFSTWNSPIGLEEVFSPDQCWGLRQGKIYFYLDKEESLPCQHFSRDHNQPNWPYICVPMLAPDQTIGLLYMKIEESEHRDIKEINKLFKKHSFMIQNVSGQISLSISNIRMQEVLKMRSIRDNLTQLYNRSYLTDSFDRDIQRAKRKNSPIGVVMMDLDFFKKINDTHGHEMGDLVLKNVSELLINQVRKGDIICRYGGEEILIIFYETTLEAVKIKVEQLREMIANLRFPANDLLTISASFGIAMFPVHGEDSDQLIKAADEALYISKKTGRNKVTVYQGPELK